jgi:pilus assembly protein Flp/PilA
LNCLEATRDIRAYPTTPEFVVRPIAKLMSDFSRDESGATAIEYALIATGISIVIAVAVTSVGSSVNDRFVAAGNLLK